jgi:hypothetical protein
MIAPGQLWVSSDTPTLYFVSRIDLGIATLVPVKIKGRGREAKVIANGKAQQVPVSEVLETWMPAAMPAKLPRTWHEQLLEQLDETV